MSEIEGIPPPDALPDKAIPLPISTPPTPQTPSIQTLRSWLPLYLKKTDSTLERLNTILSNPSGIDAFLLTIGYSSLLTSTVLSSISLRQIHKAARQIVEKAISLPPNTTVIIDTSAIPPSRLLITAQRLKALYSLISDFRIFSRLWGLLEIWKWGKSTAENPPEDVLVRRVVYTQVVVNVFYQYLENGAYLSSKGVMGWSAEKQNSAWLWSSTFWAAHVGMDFIRLYRELVLRRQRGNEDERRTDGPKGDVITERVDEEWRAGWIKELVVNAAYAPMTIHWSLEKGLVGDFWIGVLGSTAGVFKLGSLWRSTAA